MSQNIKQIEKHMTKIPDLRQAHETCGGGKLVYYDPNPLLDSLILTFLHLITFMAR